MSQCAALKAGSKYIVLFWLHISGQQPHAAPHHCVGPEEINSSPALFPFTICPLCLLQTRLKQDVFSIYSVLSKAPNHECLVWVVPNKKESILNISYRTERSSVQDFCLLGCRKCGSVTSWTVCVTCCEPPLISLSKDKSCFVFLLLSRWSCSWLFVLIAGL